MQELDMVEVDEVSGAESPLLPIGRLFGYLFYKSWHSVPEDMGREHLYTL